MRAIDADGLENLSMRRLAGTLGVEAMSLYNHFPNKAEILNAVHQRLLAEMPVPGGQGTWQEQVRKSAWAFRKMLQEHPRAIPLLASTAAVTPESLAYLEGGVTVFYSAGLSANDSLRAFQSIFALVVGHAAFHFSRSGQEMLDPEKHYCDSSILARISSLDPEAELEFGLELLIAGVERRLGTDPAGSGLSAACNTSNP